MKRRFVLLLSLWICLLGSRFAMAQGSSTASANPSIAVSISLEKADVPLGTSPVVILKITNLTSSDVPLHNSPRMYRVRVDQDGAEPPTTALQRRLTGKMRPGEKEMMESEFVQFIPGSESKTQKFSLSHFYEFAQVGGYSVHLGVYDDGSKQWLETNTLNFTIH